MDTVEVIHFAFWFTITYFGTKATLLTIRDILVHKLEEKQAKLIRERTTDFLNKTS